MPANSVGYESEQVPAPSVDYSYLRRRVARILALPPDEDWTHEQEQEVDDLIEEGLRMVYNPPIVDAYGQHSWSFMDPTTELTTADGQRWYPLPYDFDHMDPDGVFTFLDDAANAYSPIRVTSHSRLRKLRYQYDETSYPELAALRIKMSDGGRPERWEVGFHPTPNGEYRLEYSYHAVPYNICVERPYPLGSATHGLLITMACEAAAEMYENDGDGPRYQRFMNQLKTDIQKDARRGARRLGYNGNWADFPQRQRRSDAVYMNNVTYKGTRYDGD